MRILFNVTSRSRPDNLKRTLLNIRAMATNPDYLILLSMDEDDKTVNNHGFIDWMNTEFGFELHSFWKHQESKP